MQRMFNDIRHKKVKNMTQTQKVLEFMKVKEKVHYKDVVIGTELKSDTVRGILSVLTKKGEIVKLGKGEYKLK